MVPSQSTRNMYLYPISSFKKYKMYYDVILSVKVQKNIRSSKEVCFSSLYTS